MFPERGVSITESRITAARQDKALLHVLEGEARVSGCSFDGGFGASVVVESDVALSLSGNTFQQRWEGSSAVIVNGADAIIRGNCFAAGSRVELNLARSAIVSANRFRTNQPQALRLNRPDEQDNDNLQITGNVFAADE